MEEKLVGPLLSEEEFYSLLDSGKKELAEVKKVAADGNLAEAKMLFAKHIREGGYKEVYFDNRSTVASRRAGYNKATLFTNAERVLTGELLSCGVTCKFGDEIDWFANPTYNGYKEWTWQLSRHHDINILAKAYETTKDEKYAAGVVKLLTSWIRQAVRPEADVRDGDTLCWRTIEVGERMSLWPDLFFPLLDSPSFTDDFILDFCRSVYEHGVRLRKSRTQNNWKDIELAGFSSLVVLFPFFEINGEWRDFVARTACEHLISSVHPDGFQFELTPGYHGVTLHEALHSAKSLGVSGYEMPEEFHRVITKMYEMYVLISQSGGLIPGVNDANMLKLLPSLPAKGEVWTSELIEWARNGCPEEGAPTRDTLVNFEYAGLITMRNKWANPETSLFFDAGKFGRSHQHEDKLNLLIFNNGKEIIAEGHSYAYDTSDIRKYVLSTFAHNTVTVDGNGQSRKKTYKWNDEMLTTREDNITHSSDEIDYAKGMYKDSYGPECEIRDVVHTREVAFLKKSREVIVIDTLTSESEHTYEAIWHIDTPEVVLGKNSVTAPEVNIFFGADTDGITVVKGQTEPFVQGFVCRSTIQGNYEAVPTVLNTVRAKDAKMLTVFTFDKPLTGAVLDGKSVALTCSDGETKTVTLP